MVNKWELVSLGDGINVKHGFAFKGENFSKNGSEILITPGNFNEQGGFKYTPGKEKYYTDGYPCEYLCNKDDLVVAMTEQTAGLLGSAALVPESQKFLHNQRIGLITCNTDKYNKLFLYYVFRTKNVRAQIAQSSSGSKVKHTSPNRIYDVKIQKPPLNEQIKIGDFLYTLEKKIELNNKINAELEAMAKLIYDYWFVQFDFPDANGKPYKASGGKMVYNEELKREIPDGWNSDYVENLLAKETRMKKLPKTQYLRKGAIPVIDQSTEFICGYTNNKDTVISTDQPRIVFGDHTRILKLINFDFARGADGTQVLLSNKKNIPQHFFYHSLLKIDLSNYGYARHFKFLKQTRVIAPDYEVAIKFEEKMKTFYDKIKHNIFEMKKLEELRDWLLPMLMNGQITVNDAPR